MILQDIDKIKQELKFELTTLETSPYFQNLLVQFKNHTPFDIVCIAEQSSKESRLEEIRHKLKNMLLNTQAKFVINDNRTFLESVFGIENTVSWIKDINSNSPLATPETVISACDLIESVTKIFPDYLKKNKVHIILSDIPPSSFNPAKNELVLNINQSRHNFISEIFHELGHVIEIQNPEIYNDSLSFIRKKSGNQALVANQTYSGRFNHPFIGKVYDIPSTEVISMGLQLLYLNPIMFLFRDLDHYELIESILRKE